MSYLNKTPIGDNLVKKRIKGIVSTYPDCNGNVADTICNLYDYMRKINFIGGCHALSSVLYVALSELGQKPVLYVGECQLPGDQPFDHSWICIDGKIIDLAIYMPLTGHINSVSGPVVFDIDTVTMKHTAVNYGINTGLPLGHDTKIVIETSFSQYMSGYPRERGGLWTVVQKILPPDKVISRELLVEKYKNVDRNFVR